MRTINHSDRQKVTHIYLWALSVADTEMCAEDAALRLEAIAEMSTDLARRLRNRCKVPKVTP